MDNDAVVDPSEIYKYLSYQGAVTFFRAPYSQDLEGVDLAVYGIPLDCAVTHRPGTRFGPRALREQSCYIGVYDEIWPHTYDLRTNYKVIDAGDIGFMPGDVDECLERAEQFISRIVNADIATLGLGGDHLVAYPAIKAHAAKNGPLGLVHFDAHADTMPFPLKNHGTVFYHAIKDGLLDPDRCIQIGIRTTFPQPPATHVLTADKCLSMGAPAISEKVRQVIGDGKCYVSLDIDGLDPAYAPGTGTPVPGGLTSAMQREILWCLKGLNAVGGDVVEVSPPYDSHDATAILGATLAIDIAHILVEAPYRKDLRPVKTVAATR